MNTSLHSQQRRSSLSGRSSQRGVVLVFSLIALVIMLTGAVALIASFNSNLTAAGNIGFKRDLQNQAERAAAEIYLRFLSTTDSLRVNTPDLRASTKADRNYSAVMLATNTQGIPEILLKKQSVFAATWTGSDISVSGQQVKVRYLIDRLCRSSAEGLIAQVTKPGTCIMAPDISPAKGGDESHLQGNSSEKADDVLGIAGGVQIPAVYRITVRVMGPRYTEAYYQTTFAENLP